MIVFLFNPIKAGGSESMYSLGGVQSPPSRKGLMRIGIVLQCTFILIANFFKSCSLKKYFFGVLLRAEKMQK